MLAADRSRGEVRGRRDGRQDPRISPHRRPAGDRGQGLVDERRVRQPAGHRRPAASRSSSAPRPRPTPSARLPRPDRRPRNTRRNSTATSSKKSASGVPSDPVTRKGRSPGAWSFPRGVESRQNDRLRDQLEPGRRWSWSFKRNRRHAGRRTSSPAGPWRDEQAAYPRREGRCCWKCRQGSNLRSRCSQSQAELLPNLGHWELSLEPCRKVDVSRPRLRLARVDPHVVDLEISRVGQCSGRSDRSSRSIGKGR